MSEPNREENEFRTSAPSITLQPDGASYIDRRGESEEIFSRVDRTESSVIGIAGVRGAGKSSLALKIRDKCRERGYFTLWISSPLEYEPLEYFLSIFENLCFETNRLINSEIRGEISLADTATAEARRLRLWLVSLVCLAATAILIPAGMTYFTFEEERLKTYVSNVEARIEFEITKIHNLAKDIDSLRDEFVEKFRIDIPILTNTNVAITCGMRKVFQNELDASELPLSVFGRISRKVDGLEDLCRNLEDVSLRQKMIEEGAVLGVFQSEFRGMILWIILGYLPLFFLWFPIKHFYRRYRLYKRHPAMMGLKIETRNTLEGLSFQRKYQSSTQVGLGWGKLSGMIRRGTELDARPLSLPGLVGECGRFLDKVAPVFQDKAVIFIDELDKISDKEALARVLRTLKGILGHKKTHFVLTVSEDAVMQFSSRLVQSRTIFESSLEEVYYLDRFDWRALEKMFGPPSTDESARTICQKNMLVHWIFGFAIPREIKRSAMACTVANLDSTVAEPATVWAHIVRIYSETNRISSMLSMKDSGHLHLYLRCLDDFERSALAAPNGDADEAQWYEALFQRIHSFLVNQSDSPSKLEQAQKYNEIGIARAFNACISDRFGEQFARRIFEILIVALCVPYLRVWRAHDSPAFSDEDLDNLSEIFRYFPYSLDVCAERLDLLWSRHNLCAGLELEFPEASASIPS